jgi:hypothetical protein
MTQGIGGAGLFSDGKFSFYPSSTNLWNLDNAELLKSSVLWTYRKLIEQNPNIAEFLPDPVEFAPVRYESGWNLKPYPSIYLSLEQREELIRSLLRTASNTTLVTSTKIISMGISYNDNIDHKENHPSLICTLLNTITGQTKVVRTKNLIFAGGRFGPLDLKKLFNPTERSTTRPLFNYKEVFQRVEFGVRIQQETAASFFCEYKDNESQMNDPKFIYVDQRRQIQLRTFCACKDGEVIASETNGIYSASGRADCVPTGVSNIGFNVRVLDESTASEIWTHMSRSLTAENCFELPLDDLITPTQQGVSKNSNRDGESINTVNTVFGQTASEELLDGLTKLCEKFTINKPSAKIIGPTLEGIGWYPQLDSKLKIEHLPIWVCGDSSGSFRGIVAALISGHYVRSQLS